MANKGLILAGVVVLAAGGWWWMEQQKNTAAEPEPVTLSQEAPADVPTAGVGNPFGEGDTPLEAVDSCPSLDNAIVLSFGDKHTDATWKAVKEYEKAIHANEFIEEGETHLIQYVDFNNDGREDFITLYNKNNWCGSIGCLMEIFLQQEDGSYKGTQFTFSSKNEVMVGERVENGFRQLIVTGAANSRAGENQLWTWDGERYKRYGNCRYEEATPAEELDAAETEE